MVVPSPAALWQLVVPAMAEAEQSEGGREEQNGQGDDDGHVQVGEVGGEGAALVVSNSARVASVHSRFRLIGIHSRRRELQLNLAVAKVAVLAALAHVGVVQLEAWYADEGALDGHEEGFVDAAHATGDLVGVALASRERDEADAVGLACGLVAVAGVTVAL